MRARRGWVFIDVLMAMILIGIIAMTLGAAAGWHQRALNHLADSRSAARLAESALFSLQSGQVPSSSDADLTFHKLSASSNVPGKTWVEVETTVGNRRASLTGLVPEKSLPARDSSGGGS